jgi:hypothetical protein
MRTNRVLKQIAVFIAASLLIATAARPSSGGVAQALNAVPASGPRLTPADLAGSAPVTINISPNRAAAGQTVAISGQGALPATDVHIAVVTDGGTLSIASATADAQGRYSTELPIGGTYPSGLVQLCAIPAGAAEPEIACADLTVTDAPDGAVSGRVPLGNASQTLAVGEIDAEVRLMNAAGAMLYSAPVRADGTFNIDKVNPGTYLYGFAGVMPAIAELGVLTVEPLKSTDINALVARACAIAELRRPSTPLTVSPSRTGFVTKTLRNGLSRIQMREPRPFGIYVSGVPLNVTLSAAPLSTAPVQAVIFEFRGPNDEILDAQATSAPFTIRYNVGRLPPSRNGRHPYVAVTPVVNGKTQCTSFYEFEVLSDPMRSEYMQPGISRTQWNGSAYVFEGMIPYVEGLLPHEQILARDVPLLGTIRNVFNAGLAVKGAFDVEGQARLFAAEARTEAEFLSYPIPLLNGGRANIAPPRIDQVVFDIRNPAGLAVPFGPIRLYDAELLDISLGKIPVFSFLGIVNASITGGVHVRAGIYLSGVVRPVAPSVDATMAAQGELSAEIGVSIDVLFGLVEGGGGLGGKVCVTAPLRVIAGEDADVFFDRPTFGGQLFVVIWASAFWGIFETRKIFPVVNFASGCANAALRAQTVNATQPPMVDLFVAPSIAVSPSGRVLSAYVENTATAGQTPRVQVMARFQNPDTGAWEAPTAISDPTHSARSPSVAFAGPNQTPMLVWAENTLTAAEAAAIGFDTDDKDAAAHLDRQEIFYALWSDQWSAPIRLTNDAFADGMPEISGLANTAVVAWTRDTDGDAATRTDQRIAVTEFDVGARVFGPVTLLSGDATGGLNTDVSVTHDTNGKPVIAWVHDADGDLVTSDDRSIKVARKPANEWVLLNPQPLPPRADSPSISAGSDGIRVAFVVREPNASGDVGVLGTNGALWSALYSGAAWDSQPVRDLDGEKVYAEQPELKRMGSESLLVFRRFGRSTFNSGLGQLSMSRVLEGPAMSPPVYLTDGRVQQWQATTAIHPSTRRLMIVHSSMSSAGNRGAAYAVSNASTAPNEAALQLAPMTNHAPTQAGSNTLAYATLEVGGDATLDHLQVSNRTPAPGERVTITATVRNVGRNDIRSARVDLRRGRLVTDTLLAEAAVPDTLGFNRSAAVVFEVVMPANLVPEGRMTLSAHIGSISENINTDNDAAVVELGGLSTPSRVVIAGESAVVDSALDLTWSGNSGEFVSGYRVYRSLTSDGPWELIGESVVPAFTDATTERGRQYCYGVRAHNSQSAFSARSQATCGRLTDGARIILLPLVARR